MKRYLLDACALIAFLSNEQGADTVANLLKQQSAEVYLAAINLYEVCYDAVRTTGDRQAAAEVLQAVRQLPIVVVWELCDELIVAAARFKTSYRVSLADSIALGMADVIGATLVSSDHHEFEPLVQDKVLDVLWFR